MTGLLKGSDWLGSIWSHPGAHFLFKVRGVYFLLGYFAWNVLDSAVISVVCWHVIWRLYLYHVALCVEEVNTSIHSVMRMLCITMGVTDVFINHSSTMFCSCPPASQVVSCENVVEYA